MHILHAYFQGGQLYKQEDKNGDRYPDRIRKRLRRLPPRTPCKCDRMRHTTITGVVESVERDTGTLVQYRKAPLPHRVSIRRRPIPPMGSRVHLHSSTPQWTSTGRGLHCKLRCPRQYTSTPKSSSPLSSFDFRTSIHRGSESGNYAAKLARTPDFTFLVTENPG